MARDTSIAGFAGGRIARPPLEPQIRRFDKSVRKRLRRLAKTSPRLGDLIFSFPAAAHALATGRGPVDARHAAVSLVKDGAPLVAVAGALGLPLWTRRLDPGAFTEAIDLVFDSEGAARVLGSRIPATPEAQAAWFAAINVAFAAGGEPAALWIASHQKAFERLFGSCDPPGRHAPLRRWGPSDADGVALMAAYVVASEAPDWRIGARIPRRWRKTSALGNLGCLVRCWLRAIADELCSDAPKAGGAWFKTQSVSGFKFAPRHTPEALIKEGQVMRNCVGAYASAVAQGGCLIYAVRRGGVSVATMEVQAGDKPGAAEIVQLEGPGNTAPTREVMKAAEQWLKRQGPCPLRRRLSVLGDAIDPARWEACFAPYAASRADALRCAFGRADRLPAPVLACAPTASGEQRLQAALTALEGLAKAA